MPSPLDRLNIKVKLPEIPRSLPVYEVQAATLEERQPAVKFLHEELRVGQTVPLRIEDSVLYIGRTGEVEFYRASGSLWARDMAGEERYKDEARPWKVDVKETPEGLRPVLAAETAKLLARRAQGLLEESRLLGKSAFLADVVLDEVHRHDASGKEATFPSEATVRFRYRLGDLLVAGPGAKSYAFFRSEDDFAGLYHAWRKVAVEKKVATVTTEEALSGWVERDGGLQAHLARRGQVELRSIDLVYYSAAAFEVPGRRLPRAAGDGLPCGTARSAARASSSPASATRSPPSATRAQECSPTSSWSGPEAACRDRVSHGGNPISALAQ